MTQVAPLTADALEDFPDGCRSCLFWELGEHRPDPRAQGRDDELAGDPVGRKHAWITSQALEQAAPGRVLRIDDRLAGYVLFAVSEAFARRRAPAPRASDDALLLATMWVDPRFREQGVGRRLLRSAVKEAIHLDRSAVEVYGDRRHRERDCVLPTQYLLREGFEVHREHPRYPLLRLETRRTARWTEAIETAWDEVTGVLPRLTPRQVPNPAGHPFDSEPPEPGTTR